MSYNNFVVFQDINDEYAWVNHGEFYIKASKIVREYFNKQERERIEELHKRDIDKLKRKE